MKKDLRYTIPALDSQTLLLTYQQQYADRVLEETLPYGHVPYCMDNETNGDPAAAAGRTFYTTKMWDAWDLKEEARRATFDHPEGYDLIDISQNNHNRGQEHWDNLHWVRAYIEEQPVAGGGLRTFTTPGPGHWLLLVRATD